MSLLDKLFGHQYDIRIEAELSNGQIAKSKMPIEARFLTEKELMNAIKTAFEKEVKFKYGLSVKRYIQIYDASEIDVSEIDFDKNIHEKNNENIKNGLFSRCSGI